MTHSTILLCTIRTKKLSKKLIRLEILNSYKYNFNPMQIVVALLATFKILAWVVRTVWLAGRFNNYINIKYKY